jgi:RNase P subunit RPR2
MAVNRRDLAGRKSAQFKSAGALAMNHHVSLENSDNEIEGRRCARCEAELVLVRKTPARLGFNSQAFECVRCGHVEKVLIASDTIESDVLGWLLGELRPPG